MENCINCGNYIPEEDIEVELAKKIGEEFLCEYCTEEYESEWECIYCGGANYSYALDEEEDGVNVFYFCEDCGEEALDIL